MKVGYAWVSLDDQQPQAQADRLKAGGCERVFSDKGENGHPQWDRCLEQLRKGDTLVVVHLRPTARYRQCARHCQRPKVIPKLENILPGHLGAHVRLPTPGAVPGTAAVPDYVLGQAAPVALSGVGPTRTGERHRVPQVLAGGRLPVTRGGAGGRLLRETISRLKNGRMQTPPVGHKLAGYSHSPMGSRQDRSAPAE